MGVNGYTYGDLPAVAAPHGVGFVWATMLWEMYWELVGEYGFNPDIADDWTSGGNNLALQLVVDGLKLQPCGPGFVDGRNAILAADTALTGGVNQCRIWSAFARRGLGESAAQGSPGSTSDGTEAFDLPASCPVDPMPFLDGFERQLDRQLVAHRPLTAGIQLGDRRRRRARSATPARASAASARPAG